MASHSAAALDDALRLFLREGASKPLIDWPAIAVSGSASGSSLFAVPIRLRNFTADFAQQQALNDTSAMPAAMKRRRQDVSTNSGLGRGMG
jgi:hypothetical protein